MPEVHLVASGTASCGQCARWVMARREKAAYVSVNYSHARGEVGGLMFQVKPKVVDLG